MLSTKPAASSRLVYEAISRPGIESREEHEPMKPARYLLAFVCAVSAFGIGQDDPASGITSKIVALEKAWNQAYKLADRKALDALLDDQIVLVNDDGSMQSKAQFLASITPSNSQEQQVTPESISVHVFGNAATATGIFRAKGIEGGKAYLRRERFVDTWVYIDGKWQCAAASATTVLH
jgi:ketosteroid isomerase-like protein